MLTYERLKELLHYDPNTGLFTWIANTGKCNRIGQRAGCFSEGYIKIVIYRSPYKAHRLAWLYMTGEWPKMFIDHRNGIGTDNRIENIRDVSRLINNQNQRRPSKKNTTGFMGVHYNKKLQKYTSSISDNNNRVFLGVFATAQLAWDAYLSKKREIHEGCTI